MQKIKKLGFALVLVMSLILCGCGQKSEDLSEKVKAFNNEIPKSEKNTDENAGIKIGSVNMGMNGEWFSEVMNGIKNAAKDLGVEVIMLDSESDLDKEANNIQQLLESDIDAMIISPIGADESIEAIQKVKDAKIPVVTWNTTVNTSVTSAVKVDSDALGGNTGDYVNEYIKTNGLNNVKMLLLENDTYSVGIDRCKGFEASIQDFVEQGRIQIVATEYAETRDVAAEITSKYLDGQIEMIWAWNQAALLGAIDALKEAGNSDIVVMGTDMSMELANDMLEDKVDLQAVTTQLPYNMGYKAVVTAVEAAKGKKVDSQVIIPLSTYTKVSKDRIEQYIETHKGLVE